MTTPGVSIAERLRPRAVRARWVFPVEAPPIKNGIVTFSMGHVDSVGDSTELPEVEDLGNVVLLPGLINCHTHLEFGFLSEPLPTGSTGRNRSLPEWIFQVVEARRFILNNDESSLTRIIQDGFQECSSTGSAVVGEIATRSWADYAATAGQWPYRIYFCELLGSSQQAVDALCSKARDALRRFSCLHGIAGLSPHAPYTTHPDVLQCAVNLSAAHFAPLAMHLAESTEELELLRTRTGAFVELLQKLNAWNPDSLVHRKPMGYLEQLVGSARALVIHGNYLDDEEIAFVAAHREQLSVVYCPRTHAYFGHSRYPLTKMLNAGVRVVIGTDSRASNPDLSLFEELRYLATTFPEVNPETILRMGTVNGADALGISDTYGAVTENRLARFAVAQITTATNDPYEALWTSAHIHSL